MLDIRFIREYSDIVRKELQKRRILFDVDDFLRLDTERRKLIQALDESRARHNETSGQIAVSAGDERVRMIEDMKKLKESIAMQEENLAHIEEEWNKRLSEIPNISHESVPVGGDESCNVVLRTWGEPRQFNFPILDHIQLGEKLDVIDIERAAKVSGARFAYIKGHLALLQFAIINYVMKVVTNRAFLSSIAQSVGEACPDTPFIPVLPPVFIRPEAFWRMARLEPKEERYYIPSDDQYLVGSAEHTLGSLHMDETLNESRLPLRYVGYSTSFRREAGSYGKDTRGILRVHQFDKIEIESFTTKEDSLREQNFIVALQEYLVQSLHIPYRVVAICTGDMGTPDARQIDIECWIPSQKCYRETHTSDLNTDYQARRLNTRVKRKNGSEFVHMNDATVFALGRIMIAILENYQETDGSVRIPEVLHPYCGFSTIDKPYPHVPS